MSLALIFHRTAEAFPGPQTRERRRPKVAFRMTERPLWMAADGDAR